METAEKNGRYARTVSNSESSSGIGVSSPDGLESADASGSGVDPWTASGPWIDVARNGASSSSKPISIEPGSGTEKSARKKRASGVGVDPPRSEKWEDRPRSR